MACTMSMSTEFQAPGPVNAQGVGVTVNRPADVSSQHLPFRQAVQQYSGYCADQCTLLEHQQAVMSRIINLHLASAGNVLRCCFHHYNPADA